MSNHAHVIDTPDGIAMVRLLTARSALRLEIATGMRMSRGVSPLKATNEMLGTSYRRKEQALNHLNEVLADFDAARES